MSHHEPDMTLTCSYHRLSEQLLNPKLALSALTTLLETVQAALIQYWQQTVGEDEKPEPVRAEVNWWRQCIHCLAIEGEIESLCCSKFQPCQFLLKDAAESAEPGTICRTGLCN